MPIERPLDALNEAKGKRVIVELKNGSEIVGELLTFDIHLNIVLENAEQLGEKRRKLGRAVIRGDAILIISPE